MGQPRSHLEKAVLRTLARTSGDEAEMERERFEALLCEDTWVARNPHRLSRLSSTLARMSENGWVRLAEGGRTVSLTETGRQLAEGDLDG